MSTSSIASSLECVTFHVDTACEEASQPINEQSSHASRQVSSESKQAKLPESTVICTHSSVSSFILSYFSKFVGVSVALPPALPLIDQFLAFVGSFIGIFIPALLHFYVFDTSQYALLVASFGASAVLLYSAPEAPLSQPRNVLFGHLIAAFIGVSIRKLVLIQESSSFLLSLVSSLSVSCSIIMMNFTRTLHPPAAATALIAVLPNAKIQDMGYYFVLIPIGTGASIMIVIAVLVNNLNPSKVWPKRWK
jgi:CBS-domain-containing membrane protein